MTSKEEKLKDLLSHTKRGGPSGDCLEWQRGLAFVGFYLAVTATVAVAFDRDYGRAICWQRDVHGWSVLLFVAPFLLVTLALFGLRELLLPSPSKDPTHDN